MEKKDQSSMRVGVVCLNSPDTAERANLRGPIESIQTQGFGLVQSRHLPGM